MTADNIMKDEAGQPVQVPGNQEPPILKDSEGTPIVPAGTEKPLEQAPKDTLPRPAPQPDVPVPQTPPVEELGTEPPKATPQVIPSGTTEKTITFDKLAEKKGFRSPDDLATAYANLESQNKRVEVTLADAIEARQETEPKPDESIDSVDDDTDALKIVDSRIKREVRSLGDTMDYKLHLIQTPDDQQYAAEAIKIVRENPGIKWATAFEAARSRYTESQVQQARDEAKNEAYSSIENKQNAQVIPGGQQRTDTTQTSTKEFIEGVKSGKIPLPEARKLINELSKEK
ncbi:MAG TPA: hypothetical protein ENH85_11630 [Candidatus Scalindua sp.]|nr:hypothetical protein [Candidatus Scalindua sp.]